MKLLCNKVDFGKGAEGRSRNNKFSTYSHCVTLCFSTWWLCFKQFCVSWLCFGVATFLATYLFIVVIIAVLLQGLACVLLHEGMVFRTQNINVLASEENVYFFSTNCLLHVLSARKPP